MKMRRKLVVLVAVSTVLAGCATSVPLKPSGYDREVTVHSDLAVRVVHLSGVIGGSGSTSIVPIGGGLFVPMSSGPYPHLQFNEEDQRIFLGAFRGELERLHLFKNTTDDPKLPVDAEIKVLFAQTFHNPNHQQYVLDVAMQITSGGKNFSNRYRVISDEGASWWEKMNTNASEGKAKAGKKLMTVLVADVEKWLANK